MYILLPGSRHNKKYVAATKEMSLWMDVSYTQMKSCQQINYLFESFCYHSQSTIGMESLLNTKDKSFHFLGNNQTLGVEHVL